MSLNAISGWIIAACWLVFVFYWFVAVRGAKPNARPNYFNWAFRAVIVAILVFVRLRFGWAAHLPVARLQGPILGVMGVALCAAGVALAIWARVHLGRNWGMPMSLKEDPELVTTGPYATVRHPIYAGLLLAMFGTALAINLSGLVLVAGIGAYFIYSAVREQKIMLKEFPDAYPAYMKRTKMLIPFVL